MTTGQPAAPPSSSVPAPLLPRLRRAQATLHRRAFLADALRALAALGLVLLFLGLLDLRLLPFQEADTLPLILALLAAAALAAFLPAWLRFRRRPGLPALAAEIERRRPEFLDSLICATELEGQPPATLSPLAAALVEKIRRDTAPLDLSALALPPRLHLRALLPLLAATLLLVALPFLLTRLPAKAACAFREIFLPSAAPGITLAPGSAELPVHTDVPVTATIHRWETAAAEIQYTDPDSGALLRLPMHPQPGAPGSHTFTFYDLDRTIRYRLLTPSLRSPWHTLRSYQPPALRTFRLTLTPPAYTRLPAANLDQLQDTQAIVGSQIQFALGLPPGVQAELRPLPPENNSASSATPAASAPPMPFPSGSDTSLSFPLPPSSFNYILALRDASGRSWESPPRHIRAIPDLPPAVDSVQPGQDLQSSPAATIPLAAYATDDLGLARVTLHIALPGKPPLATEILPAPSDPSAPPEKELSLPAALSLPDLAAQEGDIVSYWFTATDTRQPAPQSATSEIHFIEIRSPLKPTEMDAPPGGQPPPKNVEIRPLIEKLKNLLRRTYLATAAIEAAPERAPELTRDISSGMADLRIAARSLLRQLLPLLRQAPDPRPVQLFESAIASIEQAERELNATAAGPALPPEQAALRDLFALETILLQNAVNFKSQPPSQQLGQPGKSPSGDDSKSAQPPRSPQETLDELKKLAKETRQAADDQAEINRSLQRLADSAPTSGERDELAASQQSLRQRVNGLEQRLDALRATGTADHARSAQAEMQNLADRLAPPDAPASAALPSGQRAQDALNQAVRELSETLRQATGNQIAQVATTAQALSQAQKNLAQDTRRASASSSPANPLDPDETRRLQQNQRDLKTEADNLLRDLQSAAADLRPDHPDTAAQLDNTLARARQDNPAAQMTRAANALLYNKLDQAAQLQDKTAAQLAELARQIAGAGNSLPQVTPETLAQALEALQRARAQLASDGQEKSDGQPNPDGKQGEKGEEGASQAGDGEQPGDGQASGAEGNPSAGDSPSAEPDGPPGKSPSLRQTGRLLGQLAGKMNSPQLGEIAAQLTGDGQTAPTDPDSARADALLRAAAEILRAELLRTQVKEQESLNRETAPPPEAYRRLVEEYFKSLGE